MLKSVLVLMLAFQGVRAKISSGEATLSCELHGEDMLSGIAWTSVNPEDREKLSPPTGFFTSVDGEQKYQEAIIDCKNPENKEQPWCTALGSGWNKTDLKSIQLLISIVLPPVLDYRWEGIKEEIVSNNDSMKRFSVNKKSLTTEISVLGSGPMIVDTEINYLDSSSSKPILYWRLILDEIQNGKTQSTIYLCASLGDNCTSVATNEDAILDPLHWMHLKMGCYDTPPILFVNNSTNKKFPKSTWLSTKYNAIKFASSSIFSYYSSKQEIYFQDSTSFRKTKQPENTVVLVALYKNRTLHIPNVTSGCWQILYYGAFDLEGRSKRYGSTLRQKLEQNSADDWSLVQIQFNSPSSIYLTTREQKNRGGYNRNTLWIIGDIRECFGDVRVSKLVVPAGVKIKDVRCTAIKIGAMFTFSNSSRSITSAVVISSDTTWFHVSITSIAILLATLIALGLILWYHPICCCVKSKRSDALVHLEMRNPNPNDITSVRYITSRCQTSAPEDEVVYDEIEISKNPGCSGIKSHDVSCHNIAPKSHTLEPNNDDDVVYAEIEITTNPGPSSKTSSVYYSNQKAKDRPDSAMYNNVKSKNDDIYEN